MTDERLRIPIDAPYLHALGLAMVAFARLEWNASYCCERLKPGYIATIEPQRKTAGKIARDLVEMVAALSDPVLQAAMAEPADELKALVEDRNGLLHGKPATASNGDQRLFRGGEEWSIPEVNKLADAFVRTSLKLNALLYRELAAPQSIE
jgi:hypothetical protein